VKLTQPFNHAHYIAIFGIYLLDLIFVTLVPAEANFMASGEFMFVCLNIVGDLLSRVFVHVTNGTLDG
jgi:hypothetical protein